MAVQADVITIVPDAPASSVVSHVTVDIVAPLTFTILTVAELVHVLLTPRTIISSPVQSPTVSVKVMLVIINSVVSINPIVRLGQSLLKGMDNPSSVPIIK